MTTLADLDAELGSRLARLAESVPVAPWLGHVEPGPVAARRQIRMAWLTPVVALAVVVVGIAVLDRPAAPGATAAPGGVVSRTAQGPFILELRSTKARYGPEEPIEMAASLMYVGDQPQVRISHSLGPGDGPIAFGTVEPVIASHRLGTVWANACRGTDLRRGEPITIPFAKGGFVMSADEPGAGEFMRYLQDPVLRLPAGTWHPYALAEFTLGGCGSDAAVMIRTSIEITVDRPPPESFDTQAPTATSNQIVHASTTNGQFMLAIQSPRSWYPVGEPIDITARLTNTVGRPVELWHALGASGTALGFGIEEPVIGDLRLGPGWDLACVRTLLGDGESVEQGFQKSAGWSSSDPRAEDYRAFVEEPSLLLPVGTWHVYVVASFSPSDPAGSPETNGCTGDPVELGAEIVIEVLEASPNSTRAPGEMSASP